MKPNRLPVHCSSFYRTAGTYSNNPKLVNKALSGNTNFMHDFEKSHIPTNTFHKVLLGVGSGLLSILNPRRGDMIAVMGEVTGYQAYEYIKSKMEATNEGKKILEEKPRISSESIDLERLKTYPEGTLGKAYSNFLEKYGYSPDTRNAVQFVDDIELAYVAQRYRETHDLIHTVLDMPTNMLGEVTVKWVEAIQFKLPMCATGALFGAVRLAPKFTRAYSTASKSIIQLESSLVEKIQSDVTEAKTHPGVMHIPRVSLPDNFVETLLELTETMDRKNLLDESKMLRKHILHRILPLEPELKQRLYHEYYHYYKKKYDEEELEKNLKLQNDLHHKVMKKLKSVSSWAPFKYDRRMSFRYAIGRAPAEYAVLKRVFNEIYKRDPNFVPKTLLDFGSGIGTVTWAAHSYWGNSIEEYFCVDSSGQMHDLAALLLRGTSIDNEPCIKNVYYRQYFPGTIRLFDIVVSSYTFFEFPNCQERLRMLTALWNDTKEYLVLIENGTNWGFQIIAECREYLLKISKNHDVDCYIFAPCPHDLRCPVRELPGKKQPCNFFVHYKEFSFRNSNDSRMEMFSYVIFRKKPPPPELERTSRVVRRLSKTRKLAACRLCTTAGEWTTLFVTASKHGDAAYKCMRNSTWGDLVPGTLVPRRIEGEPSREMITGSDNAELDSESDDSDYNSDRGEFESDSDSDSDSENKEKSDISKFKK